MSVLTRNRISWASLGIDSHKQHEIPAGARVDQGVRSLQHEFLDQVSEPVKSLDSTLQDLKWLAHSSAQLRSEALVERDALRSELEYAAYHGKSEISAISARAEIVEECSNLHCELEEAVSQMIALSEEAVQAKTSAAIEVQRLNSELDEQSARNELLCTEVAAVEAAGNEHREKVQQLDARGVEVEERRLLATKTAATAAEEAACLRNEVSDALTKNSSPQVRMRMRIKMAQSQASQMCRKSAQTVAGLNEERSELRKELEQQMKAVQALAPSEVDAEAGVSTNHSGIEVLMAGAAFAEEQSLCLTELRVELQKAGAINVDNPVVHVMKDIVERQHSFREELAEAQVADFREHEETQESNFLANQSIKTSVSVDPWSDEALNDVVDTHEITEFVRCSMKTSEELQEALNIEELKVAEMSEYLVCTEEKGAEVRRCMEEELHALQQQLQESVSAAVELKPSPGRSPRRLPFTDQPHGVPWDGEYPLGPVGGTPGALANGDNGNKRSDSGMLQSNSPGRRSPERSHIGSINDGRNSAPPSRPQNRQGARSGSASYGLGSGVGGQRVFLDRRCNSGSPGPASKKGLGRSSPSFNRISR